MNGIVSSSQERATARRRGLPLVLLCGLLLATGCAPKAEPAKGPIADEVRAALASGTQSFDHSLLDQLLRDTVRDGLLDYDQVASQRELLDRYLEQVSTASLAELSPTHLKALLINAYNAYTIRSILDHPDVASIKEIDGVWDTALHSVGGHQITLDGIEHNLLRPFYKDPRIHVAVNCASMSCAPLTPWAWSGEAVDEQLEEETRRFFNNPKYTSVEGSVVSVSRLLDWYGDDFTAPDAMPRADSIALFVARYVPAVSAIENPQIAFKDYDWALNRAPVGLSWNSL